MEVSLTFRQVTLIQLNFNILPPSKCEGGLKTILMNLLNGKLTNNTIGDVVPDIGVVYRTMTNFYNLAPGTMFLVLNINDNNVVFIMSEHMKIYFVTEEDIYKKFKFYQRVNLSLNDHVKLNKTKIPYLKGVFKSLNLLEFSN